MRGGIQHCEIRRPSREATVAAEGVHLEEHPHQRIVGRLHGEVVEVSRSALTASSELEPCPVEEQRVETADRSATCTF
jgi:hypothetical protein